MLNTIANYLLPSRLRAAIGNAIDLLRLLQECRSELNVAEVPSPLLKVLQCVSPVIGKLNSAFGERVVSSPPAAWTSVARSGANATQTPEWLRAAAAEVETTMSATSKAEEAEVEVLGATDGEITDDAKAHEAAAAAAVVSLDGNNYSAMDAVAAMDAVCSSVDLLTNILEMSFAGVAGLSSAPRKSTEAKHCPLRPSSAALLNSSGGGSTQVAATLFKAENLCELRTLKLASVQVPIITNFAAVCRTWYGAAAKQCKESAMLRARLGVTGQRVHLFRAPSVAKLTEKPQSQDRSAVRLTRHIPQDPERILDAPELLDDYYLNLLDWSTTNVLGVALGSAVYLWNARDGTIDQLMETPDENSHITSLSWIEQGNYMAIGTSDHKVQIWDVEKHKQVRSMDGHTQRVGALSWNQHTLSSGGRDSRIVHHDVRVKQHKIATLKGHTQEVCGLKWSPNGTQLASGGNDNLLNIWDDRYLSTNSGTVDTSLHRLDAHRAAVKALAWCPWQKNLLASGGGTADRTIRFWNSLTGTQLNEIDTHSQVCALQWSKHDKEIVSSHGYSHNQLILWKYPSMVKVSELTGHTSRVLHMAVSPDGGTVCSAAADQTLRFWPILSSRAKDKKHKKKQATASRC